MDLFSYLLGKEKGGSSPNLQDKSVSITQNGETTITADEGYDGLSSVTVTTNITYSDVWTLNTSYSNNTNESIWAFADTDVTIPAGKYLFSCDNAHTMGGENLNILIYKYADNEGNYFYFLNGGFVTFTAEAKKFALYLAPQTSLTNIKLLRIE